MNADCQLAQLAALRLASREGQAHFAGGVPRALWACGLESRAKPRKLHRTDLQ